MLRRSKNYGSLPGLSRRLPHKGTTPPTDNAKNKANKKPQQGSAEVKGSWRSRAEESPPAATPQGRTDDKNETNPPHNSTQSHARQESWSGKLHTGTQRSPTHETTNDSTLAYILKEIAEIRKEEVDLKKEDAERDRIVEEMQKQLVAITQIVALTQSVETLH